MIHRFAVSNYHSVREEAVLDLRIPGTAPDLPRFRSSSARSDVRLPTVSVLMGPNGSGKTTLLRALTAMARVAASPMQSEEANAIKLVMPFASKQTFGQPTRFRLEIESDWLAPGEAQLFRYELAVGSSGSDPSRSVFRYESLSHFPRGRARRVFEREDPGKPIRVAEEISDALGLGSNGRLPAIREDTSMIAALALLQVPVATRMTEWLKDVGTSSNLVFTEGWNPPTESVVGALRRNPALRSWARKQLESSDLGIRGVQVQDETAAEEGARQPVLFDHRAPVVPLPLQMESGGTQRLFHLLPQLYIALASGVPAVLDEIDADLHVDIVGDMLRWFQSRETNPRNAQLLVTSHNVGLLDDLEKEELFIVEKTRDGATRVHGAQDVRGLRRDARLYPKYRAGVLGGVPKIG